jgi:dienelactone hydrolase
VIPTAGTLTGVPTVQRVSDVYFNLFLPAGPSPAAGWPVVIGGHGAGGGGKNTGSVPVAVAAKLAEHGLATIVINAVGTGGGPLGTLTVSKSDMTTVTLPAGGRNVDRNGNGVFDHPAGSLPEGFHTEPDGADAILFGRDGIRQTVVDLMQLVRVIQVGVDVDGDALPDLDPSRVSYFGSSLGGIIGTSFVALEPGLDAGVLSSAGGTTAEVVRLNAAGPFRAFLGRLLAVRVPSLNNGGPDPINPGNPFPFRENLPLRNQPPLVNEVAGAIAIQEVVERLEWAMLSADPVAFVPHVRRSPLAGLSAKPVLFTFAQGDPVVPNSATAALLRAGELHDRTAFFRGLDAYAPAFPGAADLHEFLFRFTAVGTPFALAGQTAIATFLASGGQVTVDPDGPGPLFETPIAGSLP